MKTKTYYTVSMNYCSGYLGTSEVFSKYSDAREFALTSKKDIDNTNISIEEVTVSGLFKKTYTTKLIEVYNED